MDLFKTQAHAEDTCGTRLFELSPMRYHNSNSHGLSHEVLRNIMATPVPYLGEHNPRIAVTPSMLSAYSTLRGLSMTGSGTDTGPFLDTLFEGPDRDLHTEPLTFAVKDGEQKDLLATPESPKSLWWDTLATSRYKPEYKEPVLQVHRKSRSGQNGTSDSVLQLAHEYDRIMENYQKMHGSSLFPAEDSLSYFGYLNDDGNWVKHDGDPAKHDLGYHTQSYAYAAVEIKAAVKSLFESISRVRKLLIEDAEKHILSERDHQKIHAECEKDFDDEHDKYKNYKEDAGLRDYEHHMPLEGRERSCMREWREQEMRNVGFDLEGKFEDARITPAQYALLAVGATRLEPYMAESVDTALFEIRVRPAPGSRIPVIPTFPPHQYDEDDGMAMSGVFSEDSHPSVQESPRGVNLNNMPAQFNHMLPGFLDRYRFLDFEQRHGLASISPVLSYSSARSTSSTSSDQEKSTSSNHEVEVFKDEDVYHGLKPVVYQANKNELDTLKARYLQVADRIMRTVEIRRSVNARRMYMNVEMATIRQEVNTKSPTDTTATCPQGHGESVPDDLGVYVGRSLRRSSGRVEDLDKESITESNGTTSTDRKLRRKSAKISAYVETEKRRLAANIELEEEYEKRLIEDIHKTAALNEVLEQKRQRVWEILNGDFEMPERF